jgi:hypothetical protein
MEKMEKYETIYKTIEEYMEKFPPAIIDYPFETHEQSIGLVPNISKEPERVVIDTIICK